MRDALEKRRFAERERSLARRVGEVLVSEGKLDDEQLRAAMEVNKADERGLGEILTSLGYVSDVDLASALAKATGYEYVALSEGDLDPEALSLLGEKVLRKYAALPMRIEGGRLVVAMSDPTNVLAVDDLKALAGRPVRPVVSTRDEIRRLQDRVFGMGEEVSGFLEEAKRRETASARPARGTLSVSGGDEEAPVVRLVNSIIRRAMTEGASDIHIEPREEELVVRYRVDGVLSRGVAVPVGLKDSVISRCKIMANLDIAEKRVPQDGRFTAEVEGDDGPPVDVRVASLPSVRGEKVVLRLLTHRLEKVGALEKLGLRPEVLDVYREVFERPYGGILVTGPTGSGKTTTLYTTIGELNDEGRNIVTIEDPVEYRIEGITQIQINPPAGLTFASGLRSILRSDPDVVMVGEIRDHETAKISAEAALTGHLVLATLHTNDAAGALPRLTNMGVDPYLSASALGCVVAQRLARRLCEHCKKPAEIDEGELEALGFPFERHDGDLRFHEPVGCRRCGGDGYEGRVGVFELMEMTEEVEALSLARSSADEISRAAESAGMLRMRTDGLLKAAQGVTSVEEVLRNTV